MTRTKGKMSEERGEYRVDPPEKVTSVRECSICGGPFDLDKEGGCEGDIGILPVAFCPTCRVGILDFADQQMPGFDCPHCGVFIDRE